MFHSTMVLASSLRLSNRISLALDKPMTFVKVMLEASSGQSAKRANGAQNDAVFEQNTRSQCKSRVAAMPTAGPLTAAQMTLGKSTKATMNFPAGK